MLSVSTDLLRSLVLSDRRQHSGLRLFFLFHLLEQDFHLVQHSIKLLFFINYVGFPFVSIWHHVRFLFWRKGKLRLGLLRTELHTLLIENWLAWFKYLTLSHLHCSLLTDFGLPYRHFHAHITIIFLKQNRAFGRLLLLGLLHDLRFLRRETVKAAFRFLLFWWWIIDQHPGYRLAWRSGPLLEPMVRLLCREVGLE